MQISFNRVQSLIMGFIIAMFGAVALAGAAEAQVTAFKQAVAEAASRDADIAAFYKANDYKPLWTGTFGKDTQRRKALFQA
ncbi:MAG: murein L,D-transpeptidase, partial [Lentibacter algarum]